MGFSDKFKKALKAEKMTVSDVAEILGKHPQTIYNTIHNEAHRSGSRRIGGVSYSVVEQMLDAIGYEVVFRRKSDGQIIE